MIDVFHADNVLLERISSAEDERALLALVMEALSEYSLATRVKHSELDIAFAATGGPTNWVNVDNMAVSFDPKPTRASQYGDILVEQANGYVNISTPMGFIPLVDVMEQQGSLRHKLVS